MFFEFLAPLIRTYVRLCRCPIDVLDDGVQEVYVVLILRLSSDRLISIRGSFHGWLFVMVRNVISDWLGAERRHCLAHLDLTACDHCEGHETDPHFDCESQEWAGRISDALEDFGSIADPFVLKLIELHWVQGLSYNQIAEQTQLSKNQIKGRLIRGSKRLCSYLASLGIHPLEK
jgi:RNA polymerase sigma factor (sigma-70 family)